MNRIDKGWHQNTTFYSAQQSFAQIRKSIVADPILAAFASLNRFDTTTTVVSVSIYNQLTRTALQRDLVHIMVDRLLCRLAIDVPVQSHYVVSHCRQFLIGLVALLERGHAWCN
jgi:hypothetical protein